MKSAGNAFDLMIAKRLYVVDEPCPGCGEKMYAWRKPSLDGKPRCASACMKCGYRSMKKAEAITTEQMYNNSLKAKAVNFLKYSSLYTDKNMMDNAIVFQYCTMTEDEEPRVELTEGDHQVNINSILEFLEA